MTPTSSPRDPAELAVLVPYQLGYHPGPSLVLTALHGRRVGMVQRLDLLTDATACEQVAAHCVAVLAHSGAQALAVTAFEEDEGGSRPLRTAVTSAALVAGLHVTPHLVVREGRTWPGGRELPQPHEVPAVAPFVLAGVSPWPSRQALVDGVAPPTDEVRADRVAAAAEGLDLAHIDEDELVDVWARVLDPRRTAEPVALLTDADLALLAISLLDIPWRDGLLAMLAPGFFDLDALPPHIATLVIDAAGDCPWVDLWEEGDEWPRPQEWPEEVLLVRDRLVEVGRLLPPPLTAAVHVAVAQLAWWAGDGTIAGVCLERALEVDPDHRLADLMSRLLVTGAHPWSDPVAGPHDGRGSIPRAS